MAGRAAIRRQLTWPVRDTIAYVRAWAADSISARERLAAKIDRLHQECALLREERRLKDARMAQIVTQRRPPACYQNVADRPRRLMFISCQWLTIVLAGDCGRLGRENDDCTQLLPNFVDAPGCA